MNGKVLRAYIRELLNEFDIGANIGNGGVKLSSGGLPPIETNDGPERGPDDESYRNMIKEFAYRIYLGIYGGYRPILVKGYDPKGGEDPSKVEVQQALEHAAEYTGEAIDFYRKKHLMFENEKQRLDQVVSSKISELESLADDIENKMKLASAAGKGAVGKRKLTIIKNSISELRGAIKLIKPGGYYYGSLQSLIQGLGIAIESIKKHIPDYPVNQKLFDNSEYKGIGSGEGYEWAHKNESIISLHYKPGKLREELINSDKMPKGHVITNDIIKAFKKYGGVGVQESYKEGNLLDLRKKTQIQDPEDFVKLEPGARPIHNKDAYEFAIAVRQNKAEQEYYDNHMADRMRRR